MGIGKLQCHVFHVTDLAVGQRFWSEVTGIPPIPSVFPGRSAYLGQADPWVPQVILWRVETPKGVEETNRAHVDIWVRDVDVAIERIVAIGGDVKQAPALYPRPGSYPDETPVIDWAVLRDPFGNEFCLVSVLTAEESGAAAGARGHDSADDDHWREVAGRARRQWRSATNDDTRTDATSINNHHQHEESVHGHAHR